MEGGRLERVEKGETDWDEKRIFFQLKKKL